MRKLLRNDIVRMGIITIATILVAVILTQEPKTVSPIPDNHIVSTPTPTTKQLLKPTKIVIVGKASYYSRAGCLGCSKTLTMANGEPLDDSKITIALTPEIVRQHKLLNKIVTVRNIETGTMTHAKVTDTGGFARHNRIADLSVATKHALACRDLCEVAVTID